jgi:catechol 2,3-dioxygenase-like lactoylglutathione lyase family enzyme
MITGAHAIVYSTDPDADRAFLKDVLGFPYVDSGDGWLIFRLPPAEVAVHPSERNGVHELYLMTDDVEEFVASMRARGRETEALSQQGWGTLTYVTLPGGGRLGVYQPRHASPPASRPRPSRRSKSAGKRTPARKRTPRRKPRARRP